MKKTGIVWINLFMVVISHAQHPLNDRSDAIEVRYDEKMPVINYILTVDTTDLTSFSVEMRVRNIPDTFHVAMVTHPEYDDRYWRFIEDFYVEDLNKKKGFILREDSSLWRIIIPGHEAVLHYRLHLPPPVQSQRNAWRPFLSSTGGLIGGLHSFLYVVGSTLAPSHVKLKLPAGWDVATGLESTGDPFIFFAPSVGVLVDAPALIGHFHSWPFIVDNVPHRVIYWSLPNAVSFDTVMLVQRIQKVVEQTLLLFGRLPYREYSFLIQDGANGGLEHLNSLIMGAPAAQLAIDLSGYISTIAHEYFHTWNLMRIRPVEFGDVTYKTTPLSRGLWWSEGLTLFYADLLLRRAHLPIYDSTRIKHVERLMERYLGSPGNMIISPEKVSIAADGPPGMLGDYSASTHLQGELLGTMLDLIIRDATDSKRSIDDVMRIMMNRFSGAHGFDRNDIEKAVSAICNCNVHSFFDKNIQGNKPIEFGKYLALAGLKSSAVWTDVVGNDGKPVPDLRVYAWQSPIETVIRLGITNPLSSWGKAGLHTGDIIKTVNGHALTNAAEFRQIIRNTKFGDTMEIEVLQKTGMLKTKIHITGFQQPKVQISPLTSISKRQENVYSLWVLGE